MGVTKNVPKTLPLVLAYVLATLIGWSCSQEGACMQDGKHKASPGPEPYLKECRLYTENACCSENDIQEIAVSPVSRVGDIFWDRCGALSASCEAFHKRVACFTHCSPDAVRWPHPHRPASVQAVPLCRSFCRDWFEACKADLTCAHNWVSDWKWSPQGNNCTGKCVTYQQMYQDERDLCENLWGDSFGTVEDEGGEKGEVSEGRSCGCLTLSPSDREVIAALRAQEEDPDELDTTKAGLPQYRAPCRTQSPPQGATAPPPQARTNNDNSVMRKRSLFVEDVEGSGSGF
ncbi:retbindin [Megalops cyprinoides]|uniref:retbindin n=1 Tax=Megalops cyprinoides TaxID=118141 RepID=UPI001863FDA1|nr:retbindin [Megalops cyprinoides]